MKQDNTMYFSSNRKIVSSQPRKKTTILGIIFFLNDFLFTKKIYTTNTSCMIGYFITSPFYYTKNNP